MNLSNDQNMQRREGSNSAKIKHEPMNRFHKHDLSCHGNRVQSKSRHSRQDKVHGSSPSDFTPTTSGKGGKGSSPFTLKKQNFKNRQTLMSAQGIINVEAGG